MAWVGGAFFWAEKHTYKVRAGSGGKKIKGISPKPNHPTVPKIKWVKKANCWCKTTFENGIQKQEWTLERPQI